MHVLQKVRREQEATRATEGQEANAKQEVDQVRKIKAQLETQSTSNVAAFGHNVQKLLDLLAENKGSFDRMPVGPIGRYALPRFSGSCRFQPFATARGRTVLLTCAAICVRETLGTTVGIGVLEAKCCAFVRRT